MDKAFELINLIEKIRQEIFNISKEIFSIDVFLERATGASLNAKKLAENKYSENVKKRETLSSELSSLINNKKRIITNYFNLGFSYI
ncbi:MAG: hypothetical protein JXL97_19290 [Bacteroidales bacterium]|nr:hypothetical protein [Bacteroidales bacterium]